MTRGPPLQLHPRYLLSQTEAGVAWLSAVWSIVRKPRHDWISCSNSIRRQEGRIAAGNNHSDIRNILASVTWELRCDPGRPVLQQVAGWSGGHTILVRQQADRWVAWSDNLGLTAGKQAGRVVRQSRFNNRYQADKYTSQATEHREAGMQAQDHPRLIGSIRIPN